MQLDGYGGDSKVAFTLLWVSGESAMLLNSFAEPRRVSIMETSTKVVNGTMMLQLPSWLVGIIFQGAG